MTIAGSIKSLTNDGHTIAKFLVNTMEGQTDGVKVHHRLDAAKQLIRYGFSEDDSDFWGLIPTPEELAAKGKDKEPRPERPTRQVTYLDILNFDIARQIRDETEDGHLMVEFLVKVMNGQQRPFIDNKQRIKPADRMAAAKELLNRGFGSFGSSHSRLSEKKDDYDTIHEDISQRIRQHTEYGSDITRFLLDVMAGQLHDDGFTMSHRVGAAKELMRRAYDINFDGVTWEQVEGYWRAQRPIGWTEEDERNLQAELGGSNPSLPQGEGRGEGAKTPSPSASSPTMAEETDERLEVPSSALPMSESYDNSSVRCMSKDKGTGKTAEHVDQLATIPAFNATKDIGDEQAALDTETRYYGRDTDTTSPPIPSKEDAPAKAGAENIEAIEEPTYYECGPNDPDPTIDYYYEPLSPEEQAKFDEEDRREYGIIEEELVENRATMPKLKGVSDRRADIKEAAAVHGTPVLPNPLAGKRKKPTIRSP